jgi:beta-galactosidase
MYAGGTNPAEHLQESHATGYPNDLPRFDYDFQAAIGGSGHPGASLGLLRDHNAFLSAFGERIVQMYSSLPDDAPVDVHDLDSLRWAVRSDGESGFLFINTHQPHEPLSGTPSVQFRIELAGRDVVVPDQPIDIPSGLIARWPLNLDLHGVRIEWATASVAGVVGGDVPTLVLRTHENVAAVVKIAGDAALTISPGSSVLAGDALRVLVVDDTQADRLWYLGDELIDSAVAVWREDGALIVRAAQQPNVRRWTGTHFAPLALSAASASSILDLDLEGIRGPGEAPARYGEFMGRSSAPNDAQIDEVAAVWRVGRADAPAPRTDDARVELVIEWEGDVAQLRADGAVIRDRFWDGQCWRVDITDLDPSAELTLHVVPLTTHSVVDLDREARARLDETGTLCKVSSMKRVTSTRWTAAL